MKQPDKREAVKAPKPDDKRVAEKPAVVTPSPEKTPDDPQPHERYEHPERNA